MPIRPPSSSTRKPTISSWLSPSRPIEITLAVNNCRGVTAERTTSTTRPAFSSTTPNATHCP